MEKDRYKEMTDHFYKRRGELTGKAIYLFGHCEASLALADLLLRENRAPVGILDNSRQKHGQRYRGIAVMRPEVILSSQADKTCVLIVSRFYEAMCMQLRQIGFRGDIIKLVEYNTFAEYSLSTETQTRKYRRLLHGMELLHEMKKRFDGAYLIFCPFRALGDIYLCAAYLPAFAKRKGIGKYALCVPSDSCASVAGLFGIKNICVLEQKELDAVIQAVIYARDEECFIAHQDRPYVINLHKALKMKCIPLEKIYCCGVFGLPEDTAPVEPNGWTRWDRLSEIRENQAVIIAPYAKSVTALPDRVWEEIVRDYRSRGYQVFTNIRGEEKPLPGTEPLRAELPAMRSILECAGTFIGIRSGLCDVVRTAKCRKVALYPDYHYCDTKWKAIDMYAIEGFENIVVKEDFQWKRN